MREYKVGLIRTKLEFADVTVKASSPEEAKARAVDWLNFGGLSDAEEFVTDHNDDPYGGRGFDDASWEAQDEVEDIGEVPPTPEALAEEFRSVMQAWFKDEPETLLLIDKQNLAFLEQGHGDKYCATGDHCDSNQAMIDAWETLTGSEPHLVDDEDEDLPLGSIPPDVTIDLMNKAWGIAKRAGFSGV